MSTLMLFSWQDAPPTLPAFNPLTASNWTRGYQVQRHRLTTDRVDKEVEGASNIFGGTTASGSAQYQWVSEALGADITLSGGMKFVMAASQSTDEFATITLNVRVVKPDGTQRGLFFHGPLTGADRLSVGVAWRTRIISTAAGTPVICFAGDRIVAEVGFNAWSPPPNTGQLLIIWGGNPGVADLPFTKDILNSFQNPWLLFEGVTLTFQPDPPPVTTRMYFSLNVAALDPLTPDIPYSTASWLRILLPKLRRKLTQRKTDISDISLWGPNPLGGTGTGGTAFGQWYSDPLDRDQTISGTAVLAVMGYEQAVTENAYLAVVVRVVNANGTQGPQIGVVMSSAGSLELAIPPVTVRKRNIVITPTALKKGDRLLVEVGVYAVTPSNTSYVPLLLGAWAPRGDALGEDNAGTPGILKNGWIEFPTTITFDTGAFLGLYDPTAPNNGMEWPLNVVLNSFQELPPEFRGLQRRGAAANLLSSQHDGKRAWRCVAEFATGAELDAFLAFMDAAPGANVAAGIRSGSKVLQLYSDPLGGLRTRLAQQVLVEVGAASAFENDNPAFSGNTGWSVDLTFRQV